MECDAIPECVSAQLPWPPSFFYSIQLSCLLVPSQHIGVRCRIREALIDFYKNENGIGNVLLQLMMLQNRCIENSFIIEN